MTLKRGSDEWEVYQLIINDNRFYDWLMRDWKKNYYRKMKRKVYKHDLAIKGIRDNFIPVCLTDLRKRSFIEPPHRQFTKTEKHAIAEELVRDIEEEINYEYNMLATTSRHLEKKLGV